ncbi:MAG: hypothetical protein Q4C78_01745 [Synergistaceae bacterium]|nr:hypothetical protein [Synergistaceae bacterium]
MKNGVVRVCPVGFSWTMFFFGFFVPLLRSDILWFCLDLILASLTCTFGNFILCFFYNGIYIRSLLSDGYVPADEFSKHYLISKNLYREVCM